MWLHQYTNWEGGNGWSFCTSPGVTYVFGSPYDHPDNIYISSTQSPCPGQ